AFSAASGAPVWTWYTLPAPEEGGWWGPFSKTTPEGDDLKRDIAKEHADSAKYADAWKTGGGSVWMTPAYDEASKTLFVAIGNPSPDLDEQRLAGLVVGGRHPQREIRSAHV